MRLTKFNPETGQYEYIENAKTQEEFKAQRKAVIQKLGEIEDKIEQGRMVEVVRCGQCKHCTLTDEGEYNPNDIVCGYFMTDGMEENDYCSRGERREE
jgi:hypothetical protein